MVKLGLYGQSLVFQPTTFECPRHGELTINEHRIAFFNENMICVKCLTEVVQKYSVSKDD